MKQKKAPVRRIFIKTTRKVKNKRGRWVKKTTRKAYVGLFEKGKLVEKIRWSMKTTVNKNYEFKTVSLETAFRNWKEKNSIFYNKTRVKRTNVIENAYTLKLEPPKEGKYSEAVYEQKTSGLKRKANYQYRFQGILYAHGKPIEVYASSRQHEGTYPIRSAREEALSSFLEKISQLAYGAGHYDEDEGANVLDMGRVSNIREGVVWFSKR